MPTKLKHRYKKGTDAERELISNTLQSVGGNRVEAARILDIGERTLYRKIKEYKLK